jgi:phenylacetate-CoA ligase
MDEKGVKPEDIHGIEDLHKLPFLSKADLREAYPYGLLAKPLKDCVRIHSTSGTTGRRVVAFYTQKDVDILDDPRPFNIDFYLTRSRGMNNP